MVTGLDAITIVGGLDMLKKWVGVARSKRTEKKFQALFAGMMDGGVELNKFLEDFPIMDEERQGQWCDRFQEVVQSKSMKAIPAAGWLLAQEMHHPFYADFYVYLQAAQSVMSMTDVEYDYLLKIKASFEKNKMMLKTAQDAKSDVNIMAWVEIWKVVPPEEGDNQLLCDSLRRIGIIDKIQFRTNTGGFVGGHISPTGYAIFGAIDKTKQVQFRDLSDNP